ncbi:DUF5123 domain-containing protein [Pedobacter heparinus]|uniref:DUF5123 domain-containing protein n=1 Tax=Pedobacter heparinus TaxID=984 RepID=UPI00292FF6F3|nr:DUF5123 domain-containing protein [Pedobacter heparinus]
MKTFKLNHASGLITAVLLFMVAFCSCNKEEELGEAPRLFRPTVKGELISTGNFIEASWQKVKSASSYTVQISRDTFKTIDRSINVDSASLLIEELKWDQLYQLQVRANAPDSAKNSKFGTLGAVKTPKFPTIVKAATINDVTESSAIMRWENTGAAVTQIKVFSEPTRALITTISLTSTDVSNQYKIITGVTSGTSYYIELYSGTTLRGYNTYTTKAPFAGEVIDLRAITDNPLILQERILDAPSGSVIILKKGLTYNITNAISLSKTVTITSGDDLLVTEPANIYFTGNFNFAAGSTIDSISFVNVNLKSSDYAGKYLFNTTGSATVGKIKLQNCKAEIFRGLVRLQSGTTTLNNYEINNCLIDSISGYGLITVDNATCKAQNISIKNSTISRAEVIIASSKQSSNSITIENCTFYRAPRGGSYLIDYNTFAVTAGVKVSNCIFSIGKNNAGNTSARGIRINGGAVDASGNYATSDYVNGGNPIPNLIPYTRPSTDVFTDPLLNNFKIKDAGFPGRSTSGDPRWRL